MVRKDDKSHSQRNEGKSQNLIYLQVREDF